MAKNDNSSYIHGGPHKSSNDPFHHDNTLTPVPKETLDEGEPSTNSPASETEAIREYIGGREPFSIRPTGALITHHSVNQARLDAQLNKQETSAAGKKAKKEKSIGIDKVNEKGEMDSSLGRYGYGVQSRKD